MYRLIGILFMKRISKELALSQLAVRLARSSAHSDSSHSLHELCVYLDYLFWNLTTSKRGSLSSSKRITQDDIECILKYFT